MTCSHHAHTLSGQPTALSGAFFQMHLGKASERCLRANACCFCFVLLHACPEKHLPPRRVEIKSKIIYYLWQTKKKERLIQKDQGYQNCIESFIIIGISVFFRLKMIFFPLSAFFLTFHHFFSQVVLSYPSVSKHSPKILICSIRLCLQIILEVVEGINRHWYSRRQLFNGTFCNARNAFLYPPVQSQLVPGAY